LPLSHETDDTDNNDVETTMITDTIRSTITLLAKYTFKYPDHNNTDQISVLGHFVN